MSECPVEIYQSANEFADFCKHIEAIPIKSIMEIGSMFGGTLWEWFHMFTPDYMYVIDMVVPESDSRYAHQRHCHDVRWKEWAAASECELTIQETSSTEVRVPPDTMFDMLFIDGDHTYEGVKSDYMLYRHMVNPGGIIVFHDISFGPESAWYGVQKLWNEIDGHKIEFVETIGDRGIGVLHV